MGRIGPTQEPLEESISRAGRLGGAMKKKDGGDAVKRIQDFAKAENERKKKKEQEAAEAKKKKSMAPTEEKGFVGRMIDKYWYGKKEQ